MLTIDRATADVGFAQHAIVSGTAVTGADAASMLSLVPLKVRAMLSWVGWGEVGETPDELSVCGVVTAYGGISLNP